LTNWVRMDGTERIATVHSPVSVMATTAEANLIGLFATAAIPSPCALEPRDKPIATGSRTPIQLRNVSPKLAPTIPVRTTMRADTDGSAPVSFAAANARGEVMQRVKGASDISDELNIAALARSAELYTPETAADNVEDKTAGRLRNNIPRY